MVIVLASWVWAHHFASSLKLHRGPILLLGNFDGTWPGLVALLNHAASFERLAIPHSRLWSADFTNDERFMRQLGQWVAGGTIDHAHEHLRNGDAFDLPNDAAELGTKVAEEIVRSKRILAQYDPGCMGMLNAVMSPDKLAGIGMPLELLSQSDLLAEMALVTDAEAEAVLQWLERRAVTFHYGADPATELTREQVLAQMKMYVAAGRSFDRYGAAAIGIPYQYGLVRMTSASDLPEGMLNNTDRPEIRAHDGRPINAGRPIVHFNEGDVGSAVPQVLMNDILTARGMPPETTLHDVRWGAEWNGEWVWVFEISGGAAPAHFGGWEQTHVYRQPPMYFPKGGGTCSGVSKPGRITWARFYESWGEIGMDVGTGRVVELPEEELDRRRTATTEEWPIANVVLPGYGRDEVMATHRSNHITICYGDILAELIAACRALGIPTRVAGDVDGTL